jgi:hypothetical protein
MCHVRATGNILPLRRTSQRLGAALRAAVKPPGLPWPTTGNGEDRASALHQLPALHQAQPERLVAVIARSGSKTAAFVGAPFEFVVAAGADDSE